MRETRFLGRGIRGRRRASLLATSLSVVVLSTTFLVAVPQPAGAVEPCAVGSNAIVCENSKAGTPPAEWDISGFGDPSIQGFSTDISVNVGGQINFKIDTGAAAYTVEIFRTGWYQGLGARAIAAVVPSAALPQLQPTCITSAATQLYDCGNWGVSASWTVPSNAVSGVYIARLRRSDTGGSSHITFVVRDEASHADVLFQTSDTSWQAYNTYGGSSFYQGANPGRAYKLSYNRPFNTRGSASGRDFYFANEYPLVRFMEKNGYDVSYQSGVDTDRFGAGLLNHKAFLSVGHDEYWSGQQRANVEAARDAGVNLQFLSGNEMYWRTRYEPSIDGSNSAYRTLVSYKETWSYAKVDPAAEWTGTWRDPRYASTANGGGRPENNLTGTQFQSNSSDFAVTVNAEEGKLRLWRNTGLQALAPGTSAELAPHTIGYEANEDVDNGFRPAGLIRMSTQTGAVNEYMVDFGNTTRPRTSTHHLTQYRAPSGALVFSAGSVQWTWGLDSTHDGIGAAADVRMQQAQVNLFADMGAQPLTLGASLSLATASLDKTPPTAVITAPAAGANVSNGSAVTVTGTASDAGGVVAGVEVSTDGGATFSAAEGGSIWSYTYIQKGADAQSVQVRAMDDSSNIGPVVSRSLTSTGPYSVFWTSVPTIADSGDPSAVELGLRFTPTMDGSISGVRFFKSLANTGTHTGTLWNSSGTRMAVATFTSETASGWQSVSFANPVAVTAGQTYTVSYFTPGGRYSADFYYWGYRGETRGPLTVAGGFGATPAGVYNSNGSFPIDSYRGTNYFVDAIFTPGAAPTPPPPPASDGATTLLGNEIPTVEAETRDTSSVELGVSVVPSVDGTVSAIRFYKGIGNAGTHTGSLWNSAGTRLATVTFANETASGWQTAALGTPVALTAGQSYTVSYLAPQGRYSYTSRYFSTSKVSGPLTAAGPANGFYRYGLTGGFPTASFNSTNYFVDMVFTPTSAASPAPTPPPPAPTPPPADGVSLFGIEVPSVASAADTSAVELGVAFTPASAGTVTAIRFFKGAGNGGTHTGNLWSAAGANLATVTFTNETASGWQTAQLATPVALAAGTTYTVSYLAPQGRYSVSPGYFTAAKTSGPLTAAATVNGKYRYAAAGGFPTQTFNSTNYFVDITFVPAA